MNFFSVFLSSAELRRKVYFTLALLAIYRLGSHIPISGVDLQAIQAMFNQGGVLGFVNLFSGGGLSRFSIFALGILPYINASIIMQLLMVVMPKLKEIAEEGESGRKQVAQYTRYLAVGLALVQGLFMSIGFKAFIQPGGSVVGFVFCSVVGLVAGAALVMWLGELITERGIGNGASLIIFVGIVSQMPFYLKNTFILLSGGVSIIGVIVMCLVLMGMVIGIVYIQEAQRRIPVQYAKRIVGRKMYAGQNTYIPLRLIQGGVLPIIFASAVLQFPLMFAQYVPLPVIQNFFNNYYRYDGFIYNAFFCFLIFFFTYFYTAITFNPQELAENIKKYGGFIVGVRPGKPTVEYLEAIITKLTLVGAVCLAFIALVPTVTATLTRVTSFMGLGGTALLILVGVALDLVRQVETFIISKKYERVLE